MMNFWADGRACQHQFSVTVVRGNRKLGEKDVTHARCVRCGIHREWTFAKKRTKGNQNDL